MTERTKEAKSQHCAENCPFLEINYFEAIQKIPYHCALFDTFLAFDGQILRCSECLGQQRSIKEEGLNFINAYKSDNVNRSITKIGFSKLLPTLQSQFVAFLKKFGQPVGIPKCMNLDAQKIQQVLAIQLAKTMVEVQSETKEMEELKKLLKKSTDDFPEVLDSKMCKFLMSLFSVLTTDEQDMLIQILRNPKALSVFLQKLKFMPNDSTLLDNIRIELHTLAPQIRLEALGIANVVQAENTYAQNERN